MKNILNIILQKSIIYLKIRNYYKIIFLVNCLYQHKLYQTKYVTQKYIYLLYYCVPYFLRYGMWHFVNVGTSGWVMAPECRVHHDF